mgnify:CR=1 FL=1
MDGVKGIDAKTISLQLKSLVVFEFFKEYNELEQTIREVFERNISFLPSEILQQLYFYYGGKIGSYIEYESHTVRLDSVNFRKGESFRKLSINQIVKIFKDHPCIKSFDFEVPSIQRAATVFPFYDCVIRLLNMRNKLAHEVVDLHFKDQDIIELLSIERIAKEQFDLLQNYDIRRMDNMTLYVASNIVYIRKILSKLREGVDPAQKN